MKTCADDFCIHCTSTRKQKIGSSVCVSIFSVIEILFMLVIFYCSKEYSFFFLLTSFL